MAKFLDQDGLLYFWQKIKDKLSGKVDKVDGKGLSTNDYTTEEKNKLAGIAAGAQVNPGVVSKTANGLAPQLPNETTTTKYLRQDGSWAVPQGAYSLPTASASTKGGVKIGAGLTMTGEVLSADVQEIPTASADTKGGVKVGTGLAMSGETMSVSNLNASVITDGTLAAARLPNATASAKGGVIVGDGLTVTNGKISVKPMSGASATDAGAAGIVPAPAKGDQAKFLRADGSWATPTDNNTDTKVNVKARGTTKAYLLATSTSPTSSNQAVESLAETAVYLDTTAGKLVAASFAGNGASVTNLSGNNITSGTVPAARLPAASQSAQGAMSAADKKKLDAFSDATAYALKTDITSMYKHKGSVTTESALPSTGQTAGDVYNVTATGMNYVWTGSEWDALGEVFSIDAITNGEIDTILAA